MKNIDFSPTNNPGGVCLLSLCPTYGVAALPTPLESGYLPEINFVWRPNYHFFSIYATEGTKQFTEGGKSDDNGGFYEPKVRCFIPGDAIEVRAQLTEWLHKFPFLLRVEDNAGSVRLVGTLLEPMRLTELLFDTTDAWSGRRGTVLTFTGQTRAPAAYMVS